MQEMGKDKVLGNATGMRLDKWLVLHHPDLSRKKIKDLLDRGCVSVNGKRVVIAGWALKGGDRVTVVETKSPSNRYIKVYFEDRDLLVVEKPSGVLAEPKAGSPKADLVALVRGYLKRKNPTFRSSFVQLIHRLDAETSGIMVLAKSKAGLGLEEAFRQHKIRRRYYAVVEGAVEQEQGRIDFSLEEGSFGGGRRVRAAERTGPAASTVCRPPNMEASAKRSPVSPVRSATTLFKVSERYPNLTLLEVEVLTGRTHQIRAHLEAIGHPILGDKIYGGDPYLFPRQALHAFFLFFHHPVTGKNMKFESRLPADMKALLDRFRG